MTIMGDLRKMCEQMPLPGGDTHRNLTDLILGAVAEGKVKDGHFIQDSDGYWGEADKVSHCQCGLTPDPDGVSWVSLKGKPGMTSFRGLVPVTMRVRAHEGRTQPADSVRVAYDGVDWFQSERLWCQRMVQIGSFRCAQSGRRYCHLNDQFSSTVVEGAEVCYDTALFHYWESDEQYHFAAEPPRAPRAARVEQQRLPAWHTITRPWARDKPTKDLLYGCELEIYSNQDRMITCKTATDLGMIGEHDGSLDPSHGIEIVGVPGTLAWHADKDGPWMKFLANMNTKDFKGAGGEMISRACGFNAPAGPDSHGRPASYGMHVSINRLALTKQHQARMIQFVNECAKLCSKIAGRPTNETAAYRLKDITQIMDEIETHQSIKYEALAVRSETRLEMRIFRSTLDRKGFLKNVEFCDALVEFTRSDLCKRLLADEDPSEKVLTCEFEQWLRDQDELYPNLCDRLFAVKKGKVAL